MSTYDNLLRILEAVGDTRLDNPEQYHRAKPNFMLVAELLERLDAALGFKVQFPNPYPDECGLKSDRGVISYRVPQALYQAWKISQLVREHRAPRVVEIGAGLGRTAFYARELGVTDYTIVDLPFTNVSQAHFLGTVIGPDVINLIGETRRKDAIKIITGDGFLANDERYDLVVNVDSFTEIDRKIAERYWSKIETNAPLFLFINHEHNCFTVNEFIKNSSKFKRVNRSYYWMRRGYIEELIEFERKFQVIFRIFKR
jgi:hypothetical protein